MRTLPRRSKDREHFLLRELVDQRVMQRAIINRDECLLIVEEPDLRIVEGSGHGELCPNATASDFPARDEWQAPRFRKQARQDIQLVLQRGVVCVVEQAAGTAA